MIMNIHVKCGIHIPGYTGICVWALKVGVTFHGQIPNVIAILYFNQ